MGRKNLLHVGLEARHRVTLETIAENDKCSLAEATRRCIDAVASQAHLSLLGSAVPKGDPIPKAGNAAH